jgi:hypothetical protein
MQQDVLSQYEYYLYFPVYARERERESESEEGRKIYFLYEFYDNMHTPYLPNLQLSMLHSSSLLYTFQLAALFFLCQEKITSGGQVPYCVNSFNDLLGGECELKWERRERGRGKSATSTRYEYLNKSANCFEAYLRS